MESFKNNTYKSWSKSCEIILNFFFGMTPLFLVTIRSWSSAILILGSCASLIYLMWSKRKVIKYSESYVAIKILVVSMLLFPTIAVALSSLIRGDHVWSSYDSPARFLFSIPIFLFVIRKNISIAKFLQYSVPISLILTFLHQLLFDQPKLWGPGRMSTYFSDPLVFGYTSLTLGLISLVSINLLTKDSRFMLAIKLTGAGIGFYLSIMSGSRTGWLAVPVIMTILIYQQDHLKGKNLHLWAIGVTTTFAFGLYFLSGIVQQRVLLGLQELLSYSWSGIAPESSIGFRITFLRIAFDMFMSNPLAGFGDTSKDLTNFPNNIYVYASPESIRLAFNSGFHNEVITNAIRYGIFGLVSSVMLFAVPLFVFLRQLRTTNLNQRANALIGVVFTICVFLSGLSTEVFDLKYMASFYALMVSLLCASTISAKKKDNCKIKNLQFWSNR